MQPLFWLRTNQTDTRGLAPLMMRLTVNGRRVETATGVKLRAEDWNAARQTVRGRAAQATNDRLNELKNRAIAVFYDLDRQGRIITPALLKNALRGEVKPVPTLLQVCEAFTAHRDGNRAAATLQRYELATAKLSEWLRSINRPALLISELTQAHARAYLKWLLAAGSGPAYAGKLVRFVSQAATHAVREQHIVTNPLQFFEYPRVEAPDGGRPLSADELSRLSLVRHLLPTTALRDAATCFLFACYTGLAFVDLQRFRRSVNVEAAPGGLFLTGRRQKTGKLYRLPWPAACDDLLAGADALPLPAANARYNYLLKLVAAAAQLPDDLSSHVARHTFINRVRKLGLPEKEYELVTGDTARVVRKYYEAADDVAMQEAFGATVSPLRQRVAAFLAGDKSALDAPVREPWTDTD